MEDFSSFRIPPRDVNQVDQVQPGSSPKTQKPQEGGEKFKDQLLQALGQIGEDAEQMSKTPPTNVNEVDQAMDKAKDAFQDTMQAHQLMQNLMQNLDPNSSTEEESNKE